MSPLTFSCEQILPLVPEGISSRILDVSNWREFRGYWPIPGIKLAKVEVRTPQIIGTRIRVTNLDGSTHLEEIVEWEPSVRLRLHMHEFSPPLSRLATGFDETWEFQEVEGGTKVIRSLQLHAKSAMARLALCVIAFFLKRAIARHLWEMKRLTVMRSGHV